MKNCGLLAFSMDSDPTIDLGRVVSSLLSGVQTEWPAQNNLSKQPLSSLQWEVGLGLTNKGLGVMV